MKPKWMRLHASCPDCGLIIDNGFAEIAGRTIRCMDKDCNFDCPRCKAHYAGDDFWESNHDKNAHVYAKHTGESTLKEDTSS